MNKIYIDIPVCNLINKRALIRYQDPTYSVTIGMKSN